MPSMIFANKDEIYRFIKFFNGEGLVTASGPKWKRDRRLMSPIFSHKTVEKYYPICVEQSNILTDILKKELDQKTFNVKKYINRCCTDITTEIILGTKTHAQSGALDTFLETVSSKNKQLSNERDSVLPFVDYLLQIRDEIPSFATDKELIHHITTIYTAAEDTITSILSFTLVLLGMYPKIQNKVAEELKETFGLEPREVKLEDLPQLRYLLMCIKDVLRLFPIAPFIMRIASEDCQIEKWTIPKGCSIMVSIYNLHRNPDHWDKPNEFYPEHFLPEAISKRHPYAFIPFSSGPRSCVGKPLAYMVIQTILATILQHYEVEADGTLQEKSLKADISTRFKDDLYPIRLKQRIY
ncbi:hypothetical protein ILUMI_03963 [Ignelater luminosus]|uniref:Cytochrome P450 n=1 Tax=Ignelater luminosus TaxID=2038154 RepID=A0A8K0GK02_IGNLU|nr:hypothetical protein ILUMI_03963 [Ignelater luminosus]